MAHEQSMTQVITQTENEATKAAIIGEKQRTTLKAEE